MRQVRQDAKERQGRQTNTSFSFAYYASWRSWRKASDRARWRGALEWGKPHSGKEVWRDPCFSANWDKRVRVLRCADRDGQCGPRGGGMAEMAGPTGGRDRAGGGVARPVAGRRAA